MDQSECFSWQRALLGEMYKTFFEHDRSVVKRRIIASSIKRVLPEPVGAELIALLSEPKSYQWIRAAGTTGLFTVGKDSVWILFRDWTPRNDLYMGAKG